MAFDQSHAAYGLLDAVTLRVTWAREALADPDYTTEEKVWMRRYEIDVPALVERIRELERDNEHAYTAYRELTEGRP